MGVDFSSPSYQQITTTGAYRLMDAAGKASGFLALGVAGTVKLAGGLHHAGFLGSKALLSSETLMARAGIFGIGTMGWNMAASSFRLLSKTGNDFERQSAQATLLTSTAGLLVIASGFLANSGRLGVLGKALRAAGTLGGLCVDFSHLSYLQTQSTTGHGLVSKSDVIVQAGLTALFGLDRHTFRALGCSISPSPALVRLHTAGGPGLPPILMMASQGVDPTASATAPSLLPKRIPSGPTPQYPKGTDLALVERQLAAGMPEGTRLVPMPLAAVRETSGKLLVEGTWVKDFHEVYDPRPDIDTPVIINTPGAVPKPRGIFVLLGGGSTEKSTSQSMLGAARWLNERGFLVVIPTRASHGFGPTSREFDSFNHQMQWVDRLLQEAGSYYPDFRDLPRGLAGRSLGAVEAIEHNIRHAMGRPEAQAEVRAYMALSPYTGKWDHGAFNILHALDDAGITHLNPKGAAQIQGYADQFLFARAAHDPTKHPVDPFPGGRAEDVTSRAEFLAILQEVGEGTRMLRGELAALQGRRAGLASQEVRVQGRLRPEVEATRQRQLERLDREMGVLEEEIRVRGQAERFEAQAELLRRRTGEDIVESWQAGQHPISRSLRPTEASTPADRKTLLEVKAESPLLIVASRFDFEHLASAPRHPQYWADVLGQSPHGRVVELSYSEHDLFARMSRAEDPASRGDTHEISDTMQRASQVHFERFANPFLDASFPRSHAEASLAARLDWVMHLQNRSGINNPTEEGWERIIRLGEDIDSGWQQSQQAARISGFTEAIREIPDSAHHGLAQLREADRKAGSVNVNGWVEAAHQAKKKREAGVGKLRDAVARAPDDPRFAGLRDGVQVSEVSPRDVQAWRRQFLTNNATLFNVEDRDVAQELARRLGLSVESQWNDPAVRGVVRQIHAHLYQQGDSEFIHGMQALEMPQLASDLVVELSLRRVAERGIQWEALPESGTLGRENLEALLAVVPVTLISERMGFRAMTAGQAGTKKT